MDRDRIERLTKLIPSAITLTHRGEPNRAEVEHFIETVYASRYGSVITRHYPWLMSVRDERGNIAAAVGLRVASDEPLFLEHYLSTPIETALRDATQRAVQREEIVEIGSLASAGQGASIFLFVALAAYLRQRGFVYAVVTATKTLRRSFALFGLEPLELAIADAGLLPDKGQSWGSYYDRDPKVLAGAIPPGFMLLEPYLPTAHNGDLECLFAHPRHQTAALQ
jgi:hypothetical protein